MAKHSGVSKGSPEHFALPLQIHYYIWLARATCSILTPLMMPKTSQNEQKHKRIKKVELGTPGFHIPHAACDHLKY